MRSLQSQAVEAGDGAGDGQLVLLVTSQAHKALFGVFGAVPFEGGTLLGAVGFVQAPVGQGFGLPGTLRRGAGTDGQIAAPTASSTAMVAATVRAVR